MMWNAGDEYANDAGKEGGGGGREGDTTHCTKSGKWNVAENGKARQRHSKDRRHSEMKQRTHAKDEDEEEARAKRDTNTKGVHRNSGQSDRRATTRRAANGERCSMKISTRARILCCLHALHTGNRQPTTCTCTCTSTRASERVHAG